MRGDVCARSEPGKIWPASGRTSIASRRPANRISVVLLGALLALASGPARAVCGDGLLDPGEACDDGNATGGDCCSTTCTILDALPECCHGRVADLVGTEANDVLDVREAGFPEGAVVAAGAGDDVVIGSESSDWICGGAGADTLTGKGGADLLDGGEGSDALMGDGGDDLLLGGPGDDQLLGGPGSDRLEGGSGADSLAGDEGADTLLGGSEIDELAGGAGDDCLDAGSGAEELCDGGAGSDETTSGCEHALEGEGVREACLP